MNASTIRTGLIGLVLMAIVGIGLALLLLSQDSTRPGPRRVVVLTGWDWVGSSYSETRVSRNGGNVEELKSVIRSQGFNHLQQRLISRLTATKRFTVVERDEVRDAAVKEVSRSEGSGQQEGSANSFAAAIVYVGEIVRNFMDGELGNDGGNETTGDETFFIGDSDAVRPDPFTAFWRAAFQIDRTGLSSRSRNGLQRITHTVRASYVLIGDVEALERTSRTFSFQSSDSGRQVDFDIYRAWFRFRLVDAGSMEIIAANTYQADIVNLTGDSLVGDMGDRTQTAVFKVFDEVARRIVTGTVDAVSPASVGSVDPLVITRGRNDDVRVGDVYRIEREVGDVIDRQGVTIDRARRRVGLVRITEVYDVSSTAEVTAGGPFELNDLAYFDARESDTAGIDTGRRGSREGRRNDTGDRARAADEIRNAPGVILTPPVRDNTRPAPAQRSDLARVAVLDFKFGSTSAGDGADSRILFTDETMEDLDLPAEFVREQGNERALTLFTDTLVAELQKTRRFRIFDIQESDNLTATDLEARMRQGDISGLPGDTLEAVDYLVVGNLAYMTLEREDRRLNTADRDLPDRYALTMNGTIRFANVASGEVGAAQTVSVREDLGIIDPFTEAVFIRVLNDTAQKFARTAVVRLLNTVYPIEVLSVSSDGRIQINRGLDGGLYVGERLVVLRPEGAPTVDSTGRVFQAPAERIGEIELIDVRSDVSIGRIVDRFKDVGARDRVERMTENRGRLQAPPPNTRRPVRRTPL